MALYICMNCGYYYDEDKGDPTTNFTGKCRWSLVPNDWKYPECKNPKTSIKWRISTDTLNETLYRMNHNILTKNDFNIELLINKIINNDSNTRNLYINEEDYKDEILRSFFDLIISILKQNIKQIKAKKIIFEDLIANLNAALNNFIKRKIEIENKLSKTGVGGLDLEEIEEKYENYRKPLEYLLNKFEITLKKYYKIN